MAGKRADAKKPRLPPLTGVQQQVMAHAALFSFRSTSELHIDSEIWKKRRDLECFSNFAVFLFPDPSNSPWRSRRAEGRMEGRGMEDGDRVVEQF